MGLIRKHIYVIVPEEEKEGGAEKVFEEITAEQSSNLVIQEA